jgi:hypothetical protein
MIRDSRFAPSKPLTVGPHRGTVLFMASATTTAQPTTANRGMLPVGSVLPDGGLVLRSSLTAYLVARGGVEAWESFDAVHGRPAAASPLVMFG